MTVQPINHKGRKAKVGGVCFDGNRLAFFAGYNDCSSCGTRGKILMSVEDVNKIGRMGGGKEIRTPMAARVARRVLKHYSL